MNKSIRLQDPNARQPSGVLVNLQILDRILHWLVGFFQLTEEEQDDAGIYIGNSNLDYKEKT
jgi:hypothetical protein